MARPDLDSIRQRALMFAGAAAATSIAGAVLALGIQPATDASDELWRYPWESSGAFVTFSLFSALLHALVAVGVMTLGRSGVAGRSRAAARGVALAVAGTVLLLVGELISIPVRDAQVDDTGAMAVAAVFGIASILSTIGFLVLGRTTMRAGVWRDWRRFTPLVTGLWLCVLSVLGPAFPTVLHGMVGVYGLCLLAIAVALYSDPVLAPRGTFEQLQPQRARAGC